MQTPTVTDCPPVRFPGPLIPARFLRRQQRFLAEVEVADGSRFWVHVPNSGALTGCNLPGQEILLTQDGRPGRRTSHTWRFCRTPGGWVCVDTLVPNRLVAAALGGPGLPGLATPERVRPEVRLPEGSRLDFVVESAGGLTFVEVKSITWVEEGVALFPDGVTARGRRHLDRLAALVRQGHAAWQVFVVQRDDAALMRPAAAIDPAYARELAAVWRQGVQILVLAAAVRPPAVTLTRILPFELA